MLFAKTFNSAMAGLLIILSASAVIGKAIPAADDVGSNLVDGIEVKDTKPAIFIPPPPQCRNNERCT
ncbi:hypothetical protein SCHPADRAFT_902611, partial [Schizopora paradoxa]